MQEEIERLSRLVDGLLAVARAEAVVARREVVAADAVAAERVAAWEPVAREHGQSLRAVRAPGGRPVTASLAPGDLEQVLDNLIANALAAVPAGGSVRVESAADRDRVVLRIVDDGPGMTEAAKQNAFRRFGNSSGSGSGLGLAIVDRLVTANGGSVRLVDTGTSPGAGTNASTSSGAETASAAAKRGLTVIVELPTVASSGSSGAASSSGSAGSSGASTE